MKNTSRVGDTNVIKAIAPAPRMKAAIVRMKFADSLRCSPNSPRMYSSDGHWAAKAIPIKASARDTCAGERSDDWNHADPKNGAATTRAHPKTTPTVQ